MVKRVSLALLGLGIIFLATGMTGGCGGGIQVTNYYYYPNWTPDGKIICSKEYAEHKDLGFGKWQQIKTEYYLTVMDEDGSNERNIKQINEIAKMSYSPLGNFIAYTEGSYIKIIEPDGTDVSSIDCGATVDSLDWGPDEGKIAYSVYNPARAYPNQYDVYVANASMEGNSKVNLSGSGREIAWRVANKIYFTYNLDYSSAYVCFVNSSGEAFTQLTLGYSPQVFLDGKVLYGKSGTEIRKTNSDGSGDVLLFNGYERSSMKLSFNNNKLVGGDLYQGNIKGIWLINIDGTGLKQLR